MPIAAVPEYLGTDFSDASPGMRFGMYLNLWGINRRTKAELWTTHDIDYEVRGQSRDEREVKKENKVTALSAAKSLSKRDKETLVALAQRQQLAFTASGADGSQLCLTATATAPFTTGLGNEHPLENGFAFLNPYGLPYLAGSGVKGVLRQAAVELVSGEWGATKGWDKAAIDILFGNAGDEDRPLPKQPSAGKNDPSPTLPLPGEGASQHQRGALSFWDVLPQICGDSLAVEIMTPHQSHYYQQKSERKSGDSITPHDSGSPTPISFLTVPEGSGFTFHVQCNPAFLNPALAENQHWKTLLSAAFEHAFAWLGFGAKTAVGYGAMQSEAQKEKKLEQVEQRQEEEKRQKEAAAAQRRAETAEPWPGVQIKFNRSNEALSAKRKDGKEATAVRPRGRELLESLPPDIRKKVEGNQYVKVVAYVAEGVLVRVEVL